MTVICDWYSRNAAIVGMSYTGNWTIAECDEAYSALGQLVQPVTKRFDVILDFTEAGYTLPVGILWHWKQLMMTNDTLFPAWGVNVYVTRNAVYETYVKEGIQTSGIVRKHCRLAKSVDEAMQIIQHERHGSKVS